jgi:hypothetical protein
MAFTVEYIFTRPSTDVEWTYEFAADQQAQIQAARETYNIVTEESTSADGLVYTLRQTGSTQDIYSAFYNAAQPIWEEAGIVYNCEQAGISIAMEISNT